MKDYVSIIAHEDSISVCFYIEEEKILKIGEKMNEINPLAYMNGYNWEAIMDYLLKNNHPEIYEGMDTDPEAGMYVAYYDKNSENEQKAKKLANIIEDLVENESKLYELVEAHGDEIEWD